MVHKEKFLWVWRGRSQTQVWSGKGSFPGFPEVSQVGCLRPLYAFAPLPLPHLAHLAQLSCLAGPGPAQQVRRWPSSSHFWVSLPISETD